VWQDLENSFAMVQVHPYAHKLAYIDSVGVVIES